MKCECKFIRDNQKFLQENLKALQNNSDGSLNNFLEIKSNIEPNNDSKLSSKGNLFCLF